MTAKSNKRPVGRPKLPQSKLRPSKTLRAPIELVDSLKRLISEYRAGNVDIDDIRELTSGAKRK